MYIEYEPNPVRTGGIDCSVRAISKALDVSWERAYVMLALNGFLMGNMPNANDVVGSVLRKNGFKRGYLPEECPDCFTVFDFCERFPHGVYVVFSQNHVATIIDGVLYDSWDSSNNTPIYFWHKE